MDMAQYATCIVVRHSVHVFTKQQIADIVQQDAGSGNGADSGCSSGKSMLLRTISFALGRRRLGRLDRYRNAS